jgi:magnesium chelatase subunit I
MKANRKVQPTIAQKLIHDAILTLFSDYFPKIEKLEKDKNASPYKAIIDWFATEPGVDLLDEATDEEYKQELDSIEPLRKTHPKYQSDVKSQDKYFFKEFVLWGLVEYKKLSKNRFTEGFQFNDLFTR